MKEVEVLVLNCITKRQGPLQTVTTTHKNLPGHVHPTVRLIYLAALSLHEKGRDLFVHVLSGLT